MCGFITADLCISDEELRDLYTRDYFFGEEYSDYLSDKTIIQKNFRNSLRLLYLFAKENNRKMLFEVGCAYGLFLEEASTGFLKVAGIDISEDAIQYATSVLGLTAYCEDYLSHEIAEKADVICMWDTIEHLKHPDLYLKKAYTHLNEGGLIAITTGDIGSLNARIFGKRWRQIHPPTHLHYFSRRTITALLEKCGFEIVYFRHKGFYMSARTIASILLLIRSAHPKVFKLLEKIKLLKLNLYINMFDLMYVVAKKRQQIE